VVDGAGSGVVLPAGHGAGRAGGADRAGGLGAGGGGNAGAVTAPDVAGHGPGTDPGGDGGAGRGTASGGTVAAAVDRARAGAAGDEAGTRAHQAHDQVLTREMYVPQRRP